MKYLKVLALVFAVLAVIVTPVGSTVNTTFSNQVLSADNPGGPIPPLPPCVLAAPGLSVQA